MIAKRKLRKMREKDERRQRRIRSHQDDAKEAAFRLAKLQKDIAKFEEQQSAAKSDFNTKADGHPFEKEFFWRDTFRD